MYFYREPTSLIGNLADVNFAERSQNTFLVNVLWMLEDFLVVEENELSHDEHYQRIEGDKKKVSSNRGLD